MDIEIVSEKDNPLLERTEVHFIVKHEGGPTPKRDEVREMLSSMLKKNKKLVILDYLKSSFGTNESKGYAKVYRSEEAAKKYETEPILKRNGLIEEKKEE